MSCNLKIGGTIMNHFLLLNINFDLLVASVLKKQLVSISTGLAI